VNVLSIIGVDGKLLYPGDACCGSTHDTATAHTDQIVEATADADIERIANLGYHGVGRVTP
jgi:hypothetical protein